MKFNEKQKRKVGERGYIYIGTYERNEKLLDGRVLGVDVDREYKKSYVKIRCPYCNTEYDTWIVSFVVMSIKIHLLIIYKLGLVNLWINIGIGRRILKTHI